MTLENIQNILNSKKRGTYFTIVYGTNEGEYSKTTTTIVRLVKYANVVKKQTIEGEKKPSNDKYLGNNLIFNEKTQKTRLQVFLTKNPNHKPHSIYEHLGKEITKEEYYQATNKKPSMVDIMFTININNIIAIY